MHEPIEGEEVADETFGGEKPLDGESAAADTPKFTRTPDPEKMDPIERFKKARAAGADAEEWGQGEAGYKTPKSPADRMKYVSSVVLFGRQI